MNGLGRVPGEHGTSDELAGPRCLADLKILLSQPQRPIWIPAYVEPEFRRMVGKGFKMPRDQFVVACRRLVAPLAGLSHTANVIQDAGELCRVIGIVGGDRQWAQRRDRGVGIAQGRLDFGQMSLRRSVAWHAATRGTEPSMGALEIVLPYPHLGAPEVEQRQRKRRDIAVAGPTLVEEAFRRGYIPALSMKRRQRPEGSEIGPTFQRLAGRIGGPRRIVRAPARLRRARHRQSQDQLRAVGPAQGRSGHP